MLILLLVVETIFPQEFLYFREHFVLNLSVGLWVSNFFSCDSKTYALLNVHK